MAEWVEDEEAIREFIESFPSDQREEIRRQMKTADSVLMAFLEARSKSRNTPKN